MSDSGFDPRDLDLVSKVAAGRSVLLLGQDHSPAQLDSVLRDVAAALRADKASSLRAQLVDRVKPEDVPNVRRALLLHSADEDLIEAVNQPWSTILTSAVDPISTEALRRAAISGRRLRILFPLQVPGQVVRPSANTLTVLRLFGSLEEQEPRLLPPLDTRTLRQRQRFEVAALLNQLPYLVGPYGQLVVVGVGTSDWLDLEDLALACTEMPPGSVHWFGDLPPDVEATFRDALTRHDDSLIEVLRRTATSPAGEALQQARLAFHPPSSRTLRARPGIDRATHAAATV